MKLVGSASFAESLEGVDNDHYKKANNVMISGKIKRDMQSLKEKGVFTGYSEIIRTILIIQGLQFFRPFPALKNEALSITEEKAGKEQDKVVIILESGETKVYNIKGIA